MRMGEFEGELASGGRRIAVIGGGISGLAAAWFLANDNVVTLFEAGSTLGGHTHTVDVSLGGVTAPVDTGFLVFNRRTYPNLCALFARLGVEPVASQMSFSVSLAKPELEWAGSNLRTLFAQGRNILRPSFWAMLRDLLRFNRETAELVRQGALPDLTLGDYLAIHRYGAPFRDWYLLPMAAAIWSCPAATMLDYPFATFVRFCHNHGLLQIFDRPQWLTVKGGGRRYVERLAVALPDVRLGCPVHRIRRTPAGILVHAGGGCERFDEVVLACHSDQALALLGEDASSDERAVLGALRYQPNVAWLHTDAALLPRRRSVWSAWNYLGGVPGNAGVAVSYLINRLQPLPFAEPVIVTLNPPAPPAAARVIGRYEYAHPVFDGPAIEAQGNLARIQGVRGTWFAGAWTGFGFHEDGLRSAIEVAEALGAEVPWRGEGRVGRVAA